MKIFQSYTGNAMLNNALMTIEALGKLNNVREITTGVLRSLYNNNKLWTVNKRLKSYTMIFSLNNPLVNPAKKKNLEGEKIYENLFVSIINRFENKGPHQCQISGLYFEKSFDVIYEEVITNFKNDIKAKKLDIKEEKRLLKNLDNTDLTLNRTWFPLIGGLGSDAQALPQAKYAIKIHPICIVIMQFLPLSAFLYKGGILLIDSSNFEFVRSFIAENVKILKGRIQMSPSDKPIENIKDFSKGNYLLRTIEILNKKEMEDQYSDLNLWSFSNAGNGASCEIERVPNSLVKKLIRMNKNLKIKAELKNILNKKNTANSFLRALEENNEWHFLYPGVYIIEKKKIKNDGVSVEFLEAYFKEIGSEQNMEYAKYLAYLIDKYKSESFNKYLNKSDAHKNNNYKIDLYAVLVKAAENGEWDLEHHIEILDDPELIPIKNNFYKITKITHFYFLKERFQSELPKLINSRKTQVQNVCEWMITLIENDKRKDSIKKDLVNAQNYFSVNYTNLFYRAALNEEVNVDNILYALYNNDLHNNKSGLNGILRIYFSQAKQEVFEIKNLEKPSNWLLEHSTAKWKRQIDEFAQGYQNYYFDKYENKEAESTPHTKFLSLINSISGESTKFLSWFHEAVENTNTFLKEKQNEVSDKWSEELLYDPNGEYNIASTKFFIKFLLLKQHYSTLKSISNTHY